MIPGPIAFAGRAPASVGLADFSAEQELDTHLAGLAGGDGAH